VLIVAADMKIRPPLVPLLMTAAADLKVCCATRKRHGERLLSIHDLPGGPRLGNHGRY
jgi:hypothetical protein